MKSKPVVHEDGRRIPRRIAPLLAPTLALLLAAAGIGRAARAQDNIDSGEELPALELSVQDAVELALRHNLQVRVNAFAQDLAEESIKSARASFDPTLTFDLPSSFSRNTQPQTSQISGAEVLTSESLSGGFSLSNNLRWGTSWNLGWSTRRSSSNNEFATFNPSFSSNLSIDVTQPLLDGFGEKVNTRNIVVARNDLSVTREQFREQVQTVAFETYQAYWQLVFRVRDLGVQRLALDLAKQQLDRNLMQAEIGAIAAIETVQAEQAVADAEVGLIEAEVARNNAEDDLKQLLNVDAFSETGWHVRIVPTDEPDTEVERVDVDDSLQEALENDPQLRQEKLNLESRRLDLDVARNALLPQLDFRASLTLQGRGGTEIIRSGGLGGDVIDTIEGGFVDSLAQVVSGDYPMWSVGLSLTMPLGNVAAEAQHAQASIRERQAATRIANTEELIRLQVRTAARTIRSGIETVRAAQTARDLADQQYRAELRRFEVGTSSNFRVLQLQRLRTNSRNREVQAVAQFNIALLNFERAKGTLMETLGVGVAPAGRPHP
jgi:outer membrane protein TolC